MLVVTRRRGEAIVIGQDIEIRVLRLGKDGVRLGVNAPPDIPVYRSELYELIGHENRAAAALPASISKVVDRFRTQTHDTSSPSDDAKR
jgi:carbon storage regulator